MATPIPPQLGKTFSTDAALRAGVTPSRLRGSDLARPFHGVRGIHSPIADSRRLTAEDLQLEGARAYSERMTEHEFFSHATAAVIWGLPLPSSLIRGRPIDVGVFAPRRNSAGAGVRGRSVKTGHAHVMEHPTSGLPVTSPASTWALLAAELSLYDLVAVADAVVRAPMHAHDPAPLATLAQLEAAVAAGRRVGIGRLREALPLVSDRADSRPESWLRLLIVHAGLPTPSVNHDVLVEGRWIARVDLAFPELRVAIEYEGEHHLHDPSQWRRDIGRLDRLAEAGWRVIRVTKADVFDAPGPLIRRIRRAVSSARP